MDASVKQEIIKAKQFESEKVLAGFDAKAIAYENEIDGENEQNDHGDDQPQLTQPEKCTDTDGKKNGGGGSGDGPDTNSSLQIFDLPVPKPAKNEVPPVSTIGIRSTACISVKFTPRIFPTPSRESTHVEEQEVRRWNPKF